MADLFLFSCAFVDLIFVVESLPLGGIDGLAVGGRSLYSTTQAGSKQTQETLNINRSEDLSIQEKIQQLITHKNQYN